MVPVIRLSAGVGIIAFAILSFWPALNQTHKEPARVIDVDTLEIAGKRHRLYGVDGVERQQICHRRSVGAWACGEAAGAALTKFLAGRMVTCEPRPGQPLDAYGRFISSCYTGTDDLAAWITREGWAIADRDANRLYNYSADEAMARFLRKGIWAGRFDLPTQWRKRERGGGAS